MLLSFFHLQKIVTSTEYTMESITKLKSSKNHQNEIDFTANNDKNGKEERPNKTCMLKESIEEVEYEEDNLEADKEKEEEYHEPEYYEPQDPLGREIMSRNDTRQKKISLDDLLCGKVVGRSSEKSEVSTSKDKENRESDEDDLVNVLLKQPKQGIYIESHISFLNMFFNTYITFDRPTHGSTRPPIWV